MSTRIFADDDPKVLDGTYDIYGYTPKDRRAQLKRFQAAAPDLLAALKLLLADVEDYQRINHLGGAHNLSQVQARAAIAKAEGRG